MGFYILWFGLTAGRMKRRGISVSEKPLEKGVLPEREETGKKEKSNGLGFHVLKFSEADNLDETTIGDSRLLQNGNETDLVKLAEAGIRKKSILMLQVVLWATLGTDLIYFWIQYIMAQIEPSELFPYFLKRIVFQFLINFMIYAAVLYATEYRKYKSSVKNGIVAVAVCTMAGSIGVFHSYSPAFWITSGIGLMFSSIFRDRKRSPAKSLFDLIDGARTRRRLARLIGRTSIRSQTPQDRQAPAK